MIITNLNYEAYNPCYSPLVNEPLSPVQPTPLHERLLVALTIYLLGLNLIHPVASDRLKKVSKRALNLVFL